MASWSQIWSGLGGEPFDPLAGWVGASQQASRAGAAVEGPRAQHREYAVPLVVADQPAWQGKALHAVLPGRPERDQGIERQPGHLPAAAGAGQHVLQLGQL